MLGRLDPAVVPPLVATEGPRVLLADVPGDDHWGAELPVLLARTEPDLDGEGLLDAQPGAC